MRFKSPLFSVLIILILVLSIVNVVLASCVLHSLRVYNVMTTKKIYDYTVEKIDNHGQADFREVEVTWGEYGVSDSQIKVRIVCIVNELITCEVRMTKYNPYESLPTHKFQLSGYGDEKWVENNFTTPKPPALNVHFVIELRS